MVADAASGSPRPQPAAAVAAPFARGEPTDVPPAGLDNRLGSPPPQAVAAPRLTW